MNAVLLTTPTNPTPKPAHRGNDESAGAQQPFGSVLSGQMARNAIKERERTQTPHSAGTHKEKPAPANNETATALPDGAIALPADMLVNMIQQGQTASTSATSETRPVTTTMTSDLHPATSAPLAGPTLASPETSTAKERAASDDKPTLQLTQDRPQGTPTPATDEPALPAAKPDASQATTSPGLRLDQRQELLGTAITQPERSLPAADPVTLQAATPQTNTAPTMATQGVTSTPMQLTVAAPVGHKDWGDAFGQKITWLASNHQQTAELHLNPPQLGPVDVVVNVSGDQATAFFSSPHAHVREAIEQAMPKLRELMADSGITLSNTSVSDQAKDNAQDAYQRSQNSAGARASGISDNIAAGEQSAPPVTTPVRRHNGLLDTFA